MKRPALTLNEIQPTIDAISGLERLNRMGVRYVTRVLDSSTEEDIKGDPASEARDASMELCSGEQERSRAIKDTRDRRHGLGRSAGLVWMRTKTAAW